MASSSSWTSLCLLILLLGSAQYVCNATSGLPELPNLTALSFEEGYTQIFGDSNLMLHGDGRNVHISLDQRTGAYCLFFLYILASAIFLVTFKMHGFWSWTVNGRFRCWIRVTRSLSPWILQCFHQIAFRLCCRSCCGLLCMFYPPTKARDSIRCQSDVIFPKKKKFMLFFYEIKVLFYFLKNSVCHYFSKKKFNSFLCLFVTWTCERYLLPWFLLSYHLILEI